MAQRLARRILAAHAADRLLSGDKTVIDELAAYLLAHHRTAERELLVRDIFDQLAKRGVVVAEVAAAHPLSDALTSTVRQQVADHYQAHDVQLHTQVVPELLGGVRIRTPDAELDGTVRRKLATLITMKV